MNLAILKIYDSYDMTHRIYRNHVNLRNLYPMKCVLLSALPMQVICGDGVVPMRFEYS